MTKEFALTADIFTLVIMKLSGFFYRVNFSRNSRFTNFLTFSHCPYWVWVKQFQEISKYFKKYLKYRNCQRTQEKHRKAKEGHGWEKLAKNNMQCIIAFEQTYKTAA